jgi:hypothetical protein
MDAASIASGDLSKYSPASEAFGAKVNQIMLFTIEMEEKIARMTHRRRSSWKVVCFKINPVFASISFSFSFSSFCCLIPYYLITIAKELEKRIQRLRWGITNVFATNFLCFVFCLQGFFRSCFSL